MTETNRSFIATADRMLTRVERVASVAAALILFAIMAIVASDVFMRYALNRPFAWSYDLVSLYLEIALFYFMLSRNFATHAHIGVDILHYYVSPRTRRIFELLGCAVSLPLFAFITYAGGMRALSALAGGDVYAGGIAWPSGLSIMLVPLGAALLTLRLAVNLAAHLMALRGGREIIALPPLARTAAERMPE